MCGVKFIYSEVTRVRLEFLQGVASFHWKCIYNVLAQEAIVFRYLGVVDWTVTVLYDLEFSIRSY